MKTKAMKRIIFLPLLLMLFVFNTYGQWNQINSPDDNEAYIDVEFLDELNGYLIDTWKFYKTNNGGLTWQHIVIPDARDRFSSIFLLEDGTLWISSDKNSGLHIGGTILKSVDGGNTWEVSFDIDFYGFKKLFFLDEDHGWAASDYKKVFYTSDGGINWIESEDSPLENIKGLCFTDENTGWISGGSISGIVCKSVDGGYSWDIHYEKEEVNQGFWDIEFVNEQKGFIGGQYRNMVMTEDGGESWVTLSSFIFQGVLTGLPSDYAINDLEFIDPNRGWIIGGPC